jgi:integrase
MARPPRRKRRLRGTGSVFQRPDGRWEGRWQAPQDGSGERLWIRKYGRSESEADSLLADAIRDHKRGAAIADTTTTIADYLDGWLDRIAPSLKPSTYRAYEGAVRIWIVPRVGSIAVGSLTGLHVQRMVDTTASANGIRSAGIAHAVLRKALADARRLDRIVDRNVAQDAVPPKWRRNLPTPWTIDEATSFLDSLRGDRDEALYLIAAMMGLRPAEALAIGWSRIDLEKGRLTIDRAIHWPVGRTPYLGRPKSEAANRTVSIPPRVLRLLKKMKRAHEETLKFMGDGWLNPDLVFYETGPLHGKPSAGRPRRLDTYNHRFARRISGDRWPHVRLYDLRRLAATLIIEVGGLEAARRALGHSSQRLAAETYGYELEGTSRAVAAGVERLLTGSYKLGP